MTVRAVCINTELISLSHLLSVHRAYIKIIPKKLFKKLTLPVIFSADWTEGETVPSFLSELLLGLKKERVMGWEEKTLHTNT